MNDIAVAENGMDQVNKRVWIDSILGVWNPYYGSTQKIILGPNCMLLMSQR